MKADVISFTGFESLSGSNLRLFHLCKELIRRGNELRFIVPSKADAISCRKQFGSGAVDVGMDISRFSRSRLKRYPIFAYRAGKMVGECDIVFGQSLPSALGVRRAKTDAKRAIDYVDLWSEYWAYARPGIKGKLVYRAVRKAESHSLKADRIFTITTELKRMLAERGANPEKINVIRDGVDTRMFRPMKMPGQFLKRHGLERGLDYVVYQGGIAAHDGVQFLVDAAPVILRGNPDLRFLVVGDGDYLPEIRRLVADLGVADSFVFTGWVPYKEMPYFMNLAKLNVVPIPDAPATRGVVTLKLFEAMACGTPTVIGDVPGVRENVKHGETAYLVKSEDKNTLADGVNRLLEDKALYNKIKKNGLLLSKKHDWRNIAKDMADGLHDLAE